MAIQYFKQDLTPILSSKDFQVFAHGCNCFNTMGAGIAKTVKQIFPQVYKADQSTRKGDKSKLGTIDTISVGDSVNPKFVINAYTQYDFRGMKPNVNYKAIEKCFVAINDFMTKQQITELTIPKIGAGLAGGDWDKVESILQSVFPDKYTIKVFFK